MKLEVAVAALKVARADLAYTARCTNTSRSIYPDLASGIFNWTELGASTLQQEIQKCLVFSVITHPPASDARS